MTSSPESLYSSLRRLTEPGRAPHGLMLEPEQLKLLLDLCEYAQHDAWRCHYRTRYGRCVCGLDELCDQVGLERRPPNDPEGSAQQPEETQQ